MRLMLVRHGKAGDRESWSSDDSQRPLTKKGVDEFHQIAKHIAGFDKNFLKIYSSPLVRTMQTAEILREYYDLKIEERVELAFTSDLEDLLLFIKTLKPEGSYILVGHDPTLSQFGSWLLSGKADLFMEFKKGSAALLTSLRAPAPGEFVLEWLVPPKMIIQTV